MCFTNLLLWFAVPVHDHLFNASVCHSKKERGRNFEGIGQPGNPGALDAVDPVVMPSLSASPNSAKLDTVFLLSNGRLTSLSPTGERLWQTQTSAIWRKQHTTLSTMANHEAGLRTDSVIVPSLRYVNLHAEKSWEEADADDLQLLAVGDANLCLVAEKCVSTSPIISSAFKIIHVKVIDKFGVSNDKKARDYFQGFYRRGV